MKNKIKAFTLVELIVVISLIMLLSAVSVPVYKSYTEKGAIAEGYALLARIASAQDAYYSQYGNFLAHQQSSDMYGYYTTVEYVLGINALTNKYFRNFKPAVEQRGDIVKYQVTPTVKGSVNGRDRILDMVCNITSGTTFIIN